MIDADIERKRSVYSGLTVEQERKHLELDEGQSRGWEAVLCVTISMGGTEAIWRPGVVSHPWGSPETHKALGRLVLLGDAGTGVHQDHILSDLIGKVPRLLVGYC